nr:hypothetical protein [Tanacetum cinerariifolium]
MKIPLLEYFATVSAKEFPVLSCSVAPAEEFALLDEDKDYSQVTITLSSKLADPTLGNNKCPLEETSKSSASESSAKKKGRIVAITTEDMQKRRNDVKARTALLLALPDEHQLRFNNLAPEWLIYTIVWRNTDDLDKMSLDDVYNHLKVYEPKVQKKPKTNSQNMVFISSSNTSSEKGEIYTTRVPTSSTQVSTASTDMDEDDIEEIDIKWNMALLSMRADRFWKKTGKKITVQGSDVASFDKSKSYMANEEENHALVADEEVLIEFALMAKSSSSSENEVYDDSFCSKSCRKNTEYLNTKITKLNKELSDCKTNLYHYKLGLTEFADDTVTNYSKPMPRIDSSKSNTSDLQNSNSSVSEHRESSDSIMSKPMIKFVKAADSPRVIKTNKTETARKPPVKYTEMYRNTSKSPKKPYDGGYVSFGQGGGKITGKCIIKTGKLKFENVYFVKELKYNLFSMSQMRDNKNSVMFTDSECIVLGKDFKLKDNNNVLLRTPRQHNMYYIDLNNIVPHKNLTCLVAKASADESMLWHSRLGHLNFKTMNKLGRNNLVKGLPSKCFENDHTCVACLKGKHHKASCKTKCDNGGEFKNKEMNEFCTKKGIKREFSSARTPQQNRVAERRNRTLIEAARTMLADDKLPVTFWVEVVNTAYFLENKLIEKGAGPNWLFDIDTLTNSMNYVLVVVTGTPSTNISGTKDVASQVMKKDVSSLRYIVLPNWFHEAHMESSNNDAQDACNADESSGISNPIATLKSPPTDQMESSTVESAIPTVSSPVPTACLDISLKTSSDSRLISKEVLSQEETLSLDNALSLSNRFEDTIRVEADLSNMESSIPASPTPTFRIYKDHPKSQILFCLFSCFLSHEKPKRIVDALKDPSWIKAMQEELLQFKIQNVWNLVDCPKGIRPIGTKWVLKNKKDERGIVIRNKARLVAQGHTHEEGINYKEVFAPVAMIEAIRLFLAYASFMGFIVYQMDVKSAFLYGTIDEEAPRAWYGTLSKYLLDNGFQRALMHEKFQMSDMGELTFFLGLQVLQKKHGILLSQDKYVGDILNKFRYSDVRSANTPMDKENPWGKDRPDSDYGGATQDRKSTTREYVAAASGCGQVLWIQN